MTTNRFPTTRLQRLFKMGRLATGVAGSVVNQGLRQAATGQRPKLGDLLLTPGNAQKIAERLAEMRGAAMKIGQLLSMEAGQVLPREITDELSRLRDNAHSMVPAEVHAIMAHELGPMWRDRFGRFDDQAFSAASIGQVHKAEDPQGRRLAVKIQYPGVDQSIDSDIDNAMSILRLFKLIPAGMDLTELVATAKTQLHDEADYRLEARYLEQYRRHLSGSAQFAAPRVIEDCSTARVLTMSFVDGDSIETLAANANPHLRDRVVAHLIELTLREFLEWGVVQTDPNFANFRYDHETGTIGLVDFGAIRVLTPELREHLRRLLRAVLDSGMPDIARSACNVGYIQPNDPFNYRLAVVDLLKTAAEPARNDQPYEFGSTNLAQRMAERLYQLRAQQEFQRIPPAEILFLHRKLAGIFMLAARLRARVNVRAIVERIWEQSPAPSNEVARS